MTWLAFIGKALLIGTAVAAFVAVSVIVAIMVMLWWDAAHGRNPFL